MTPPLSSDVMLVACVYEAVAIVAGLPTVTRYCGLHPMLGVAIIVLGTIHLVLEVRRLSA